MKPARYHQGFSFRQFFGSRFLFIPAFLLFVIIGIGLLKEILRKMEVNAKISELEKEVDTLEKRNAELGSFINGLNSNLWQEKQAREKLGLQKEGEKVVIVNDRSHDGEQDETIQTLLVQREKSKRSNFEKWKQYFFE